MRFRFVTLPSVLLLIAFQPASAGTVSFNQLVVFGDSLSDNGNAAILLGGTLPGNYAPNAFTDGPNTNPKTTGPFGLWIDQFAAISGVPDPLPFLANQLGPANTNYAVASAQTGAANPQDMTNQLAAFAAAHPGGAPSNALYVLWGGANDLFNGTNSGKGAADNVAAYIQLLAGQGAKSFLWLNLPQLGNTPRGALGDSAGLNTQSTNFDNEWAFDIALLKNTGVNVTGVDINSLFKQVISTPGQFGFTNVTAPAQGISGDPNSYLFWDGQHPTTAGHNLVAQAAESALTATPEPGSLALFFGATAAVCVWRRGRSAR